MIRALSWTLLLSLMATGCVGSNDSDPPASTPPPPASGETPEPIDTLATVESPIAFALREDATIRTAVAVCPNTLRNAASHCLTPIAPSGVDFQGELPGAVRRMELTLTWTAGTAVMEQLEISAVACAKLNEDWDCTWIGDARGPSPLTLTADAEEGTRPLYYIEVGPPGHWVGPVYSAVTLDQRFTLEGTIFHDAPATN